MGVEPIVDMSTTTPSGAGAESTPDAESISAAVTAAPETASTSSPKTTTATAPAAPETPTEPENKPAPVVFSWLQPHYQFVVVFVGPEEVPFGLQKDFLCARSTYYRQYFAHNDDVESVVRLPDTPVEVFAYAQNFLYTGAVFPNDSDMPTYEVLVGVWKLGHELGIDGLCSQTLEAMREVRQATQSIPAPPLLVQVWKDTPEGSSIRKLLLEWAAEYVRSSESNAEFAKSLPQEVLSELVLAMSRTDTASLVQLGGNTGASNLAPPQPQRKVVHYLDEQEEDEESMHFNPAIKKQRRSEPLPHSPAIKTAVKKPRALLPSGKPVPRRRSNATANGDLGFTTEQKLHFCQDLLARMLSGPGFWTRLVGPFREPVDPAVDNVPDYFEKITKPMDLTTMKAKMDRNEYTSDQEFLADMNQIFANCKTYWKPTDGIYAACEKLEKTFIEKYAQMNKWLTKMEGSEEH